MGTNTTSTLYYLIKISRLRGAFYTAAHVILSFYCGIILSATAATETKKTTAHESAQDMTLIFTGGIISFFYRPTRAIFPVWMES